MSLSKEEKQRVRKALMRRISVKKLQTPLEYHYFAWHWNWDNGIKPLEWIIRQPNCDQGTALLIYWYAALTWFCQYQDKKEVRARGGNVKHYEFIKEIEQRVAENFSTTRAIYFSPNDDSGYDWTAEYADKPVKSPIPKHMLQASPGAKLERNILWGFMQRDLTEAEVQKVNRNIASGFNVLHVAFPQISEQSSPDDVVAAIKDYVNLEREVVGKKQVSFDGPQAQVGWVLAKQIERKYGWVWQMYSFDDGDTEHTGLMSPDNILIVMPPNSLVASINLRVSENAIVRFFDLLGTYTRTQDFREFYALNWMTFVRR
jgi:hypothetical protein